MSKGQECELFVGNLGNNASKSELESVFCHYGPLKNIWVASNPSGHAFIEFQDPTDAKVACRNLNGTKIGGMRVRVEMSTGRSQGRHVSPHQNESFRSRVVRAPESASRGKRDVQQQAALRWNQSGDYRESPRPAQGLPHNARRAQLDLHRDNRHDRLKHPPSLTFPKPVTPGPPRGIPLLQLPPHRVDYALLRLHPSQLRQAPAHLSPPNVVRQGLHARPVPKPAEATGRDPSSSGSDPPFISVFRGEPLNRAQDLAQAGKRDDEGQDLVISGDIREKTLLWAASLEDGNAESPKLPFIKNLLRTCGYDECRKVTQMLKNRKRRVAHDRKALLEVGSPSVTVTVADVDNSSSKSLKRARITPWWEAYNNEDIVIMDSEHVAYKIGEKQYVTHLATIDIIDGNGASLLAEKVYHKKGSFEVNSTMQKITGYKRDTFDNPEFKSEEVVKEAAINIMRNKLVITCGGISDFAVLDINADEMNWFDLQHHFFLEKTIRNDAKMRQPHSLRSLMNHYFHESIQEGIHTSLEDCKYTLKMFQKYKEVKLNEQPERANQRYNTTRVYDDIPVIQSKHKKAKKKSACAIFDFQM